MKSDTNTPLILCMLNMVSFQKIHSCIKVVNLTLLSLYKSFGNDLGKDPTSDSAHVAESS